MVNEMLENTAAETLRLFWDTPFEEYTVIEGLLLLILLVLVCQVFIILLRRR